MHSDDKRRATLAVVEQPSRAAAVKVEGSMRPRLILIAAVLLTL
ncbi:MAG: hypothetical protein ABIP94_02940 [Planctomycetota bacterium]